MTQFGRKMCTTDNSKMEVVSVAPTTALVAYKSLNQFIFSGCPALSLRVMPKNC